MTIKNVRKFLVYLADAGFWVGREMLLPRADRLVQLSDLFAKQKGRLTVW